MNIARLLPCAFALAVPLVSGCSRQDPEDPPTPPAATAPVPSQDSEGDPDRTEEVRSLLQALVESAGGPSSDFDLKARNLPIPEPEQWFSATFNPEVAPGMTNTYKGTLATLEERVRGELRALHEGGAASTCRVSRYRDSGDASAPTAIRRAIAAMTKRCSMYIAEFKNPKQPAQYWMFVNAGQGVHLMALLPSVR